MKLQVGSRRAIDDFFSALTDDGVKGEVLKAQIAADGEAKKAELTSETFNFQRGAKFLGVCATVVLATLFASCTTMCVSDKWQEVQDTKTKAEHPEAFVNMDRAAAEKAQAEANAKNAATCAQYPNQCHIVTTNPTAPTAPAAAPPASAAPAVSK